MTDRNHELDQMLQAAVGMGASASASALRNVAQLACQDSSQETLDQVAVLSSLSERAQTCLSVAARAEAEGDAKLAELGWLQALSLMNHLAEETAELDMPATEEIQHFSRQVAGRAH